MTDKEQKIVDGVDVSSCPACNLNCGIPQCSEFFKHFPSSIYCRDNPNCLFKQLARKTQECEKLEEENKYLKEYRRKNQTCQECYDDGYQTGLYENKILSKYKSSILKIKYHANQIKKWAFQASADEACKILDIINKLGNEK